MRRSLPFLCSVLPCLPLPERIGAPPGIPENAGAKRRGFPLFCALLIWAFFCPAALAAPAGPVSDWTEYAVPQPPLPEPEPLPPWEQVLSDPELRAVFAPLSDSEARPEDIPAPALRAILINVKNAPGATDTESAARLLRRKTAAWRRLAASLQTPPESVPDTAFLRRRALKAVREGRFADAEEALREARQRGMAAFLRLDKTVGPDAPVTMKSQRGRRLLSAAVSEGDAAAAAGLETTPDGCRRAAVFYGKAARLAELLSVDVALDCRYAQADALRELGEVFGERDALRRAAEAFQSLLGQIDRDARPEAWGRAQNALGDVLLLAGGREPGTEALEQAVAAYRAALEVRDRGRAPEAWAATRSHLGSALLALGDRKPGTEALEQAVAASQAALEVYGPDRFPAEWTLAQNTLGAALLALGERASGPQAVDHLRRAEAAFRNVAAHTRERFPLQWAAAQSRLSAALLALSRRESGPQADQRRRQAVSAGNAALEMYDLERFPFQWAAVRSILEAARRGLSDAEALPPALPREQLERLVAAFENATETCDRDRRPLDWAAAGNNLGNALLDLSRRESGPLAVQRLRQAVSAYKAALEVRTPDRLPLQWAATRRGLGTALLELGRRDPGPRGTRALKQAAEAFQEVLEAFPEEVLPRREEARRKLAEAQRLLDRRIDA